MVIALLDYNFTREKNELVSQSWSWLTINIAATAVFSAHVTDFLDVLEHVADLTPPANEEVQVPTYMMAHTTYTLLYVKINSGGYSIDTD